MAHFFSLTHFKLARKTSLIKGYLSQLEVETCFFAFHWNLGQSLWDRPFWTTVLRTFQRTLNISPLTIVFSGFDFFHVELDVFSSPSAQITHTNRPTELASHHSRASRRPREDGGAGPKSFDTPRATNPRSPTARTQPRRMRRKSDNLNARENRFLLGFPTGCCPWRFSAFLDFEEGNLLGNFTDLFWYVI